MNNSTLTNKMPNNSTLKATVAQSDKASSPPAFDPWILWVTFRRCWAWALPVGAVLSGLTAFAVLATFVPTYRATHILEANQDYKVFKGINQVIRNLARTESQLILHPIVLDAVLSDETLQTAPSLSDPETAETNLKKNMRITSGGNEYRLVISYEDSDRESAAAVCNAIASSYLKQRNKFDEKRTNNLAKWLSEETDTWEKKVEEHQEAVKELQEVTWGSPKSLENDNKFTLATRMRSEIAELDLEILVLQEYFAMNDESEDATAESNVVPVVAPEIRVQRKEPTEFEILNLVQSDPEVSKAKQQINRYEEYIINIQDQRDPRTRRDDIKKYQKQAEEWRGYLKTAEAAARVKVEEQLLELVEENYLRELAAARAEDERMRSSQVFINRQKLKGLMSKQKVLKEQYQAERKDLEEYGGTSAELQFANEDLSVATSLLHKLRDRVATIDIEHRSDGNVRTIASATIPTLPVEEIPYKHLILACGLALFLPFLPGLLWEIRSLRYTDSTMCDKNGLAVIGEIARLPTGPRSAKGRRVFEESVDTLRSSLFLSVDTKNVRSIAVVSSISGEGKSSVSSQLALSIAKATGETVLIVDADLRCPDQHDIFGLDNGPGLAAVLARKSTLSDATDKSLGELVHVLPAGRLSTSPHRLVTQKTMQSFIKNALTEYSYIVIDTAPVLAAGESLAVAACVDAALMCVMRDISRVDNSTRAIRRLEAAGANLAGTVFSGVSARQYAYRYGNYHYGIDAETANDSASAS